MTRCKLHGLVASLILSSLSLQAGAVNIFPTCEINESTKTISVTDGYENYIKQLPGGDVEYIAPTIDPNNDGKLYSRIYNTGHMLTKEKIGTLDENGKIITQADFENNWLDRNQLYGDPTKINGFLVPVLMEATVLDKNELRVITDQLASGQTISQRTEVFSEPVNFEAEEVTVNGQIKYRNDLIPLAVYKFWGLFVPQFAPQETGKFKIRFQKDDGLIVHLDLGDGLKPVIDEFKPIDDFNNEGQRITVARHDGNDVFDLSSGTPYPIHIQWFNYDSAHALQMEYSASNANDWQVVPQSWFNAGRDPRGITVLELNNKLSPANLNPDISDLLANFTVGDFEVEGVYDFDDQTQGGLHPILVKNEAGFETTCNIVVASPIKAIALVKSQKQTQYKETVTVLLGESLTFKGSDSLSNDADSKVNSYEWDLGDSSSKSSADFDYSYTAAGTYKVTLTVEDDFGSDTKQIQVIVQDPPKAKAVFSGKDESVRSISVILGESIDFDGSWSTDSDGTIQEYSWSFGDTLSETGSTATHSYTKNGTYTVTLTVTDNDGLSSTDTVMVTVQQLVDDSAPTCSLTIKDQEAKGEASDAILNEDINGDGQLNAGEDLNYNGKIDYNSGIASIALASSSKNLSLDFKLQDALTATFAVTLSENTHSGSGTVVVTDIAGNICSMNLKLDGSSPPTAVISVSANGKEIDLVKKQDPDTGQELQGFIVNQFEEVSIEGLDSFDGDGVVVSYLWKGLGNDFSSISSKQTFKDKGFREISLTVVDNDNLSNTQDLYIWINEAPFIDISKIDISYGEEGVSGEERGNFTIDGDRIIIEHGKAMLLDASGSYDDSKIEKYTWCPTIYFNEKDKTCEPEPGAEHLVGHTAKYEYTAGQYSDESMTLILEDEHGASSAATFDIVKYEAKYEASGSMGLTMFGLLASLLWWRRKQHC